MQLQPPPADTLDGCVIRLADRRVVLVMGDLPPALPGEVLHRGPVTIYYALALLYEQDYLLPQWAYDDFRREYHGAAAVDFMLRRGDAFPRADVVGRRVSNGQRTELFLKQLDLGRGLLAFVYPHADAPQPLARLDAALWVDETAHSCTPLAAGDPRAPALLRQAVPCYVLPMAWLTNLPSWLGAERVR